MITFKDYEGNEWITAKNNILLKTPKSKTSLPMVFFKIDNLSVFVSWEILDNIKNELLK